MKVTAGRARKKAIALAVTTVLFALLAPAGCASGEEVRYFLEFRCENARLYHSTYRCDRECPPDAAREAPRHFRAHFSRAARRFFKIECVQGETVAGVYLFDGHGRVTEQRDAFKTVKWTYTQDRKTAGIWVRGDFNGRNVFEYEGGVLKRILIYNERGALIKTVPAAAAPVKEPPRDDGRLRGRRKADAPAAKKPETTAGQPETAEESPAEGDVREDEAMKMLDLAE